MRMTYHPLGICYFKKNTKSGEGDFSRIERLAMSKKAEMAFFFPQMKSGIKFPKGLCNESCIHFYSSVGPVAVICGMELHVFSKNKVCINKVFRTVYIRALRSTVV